MKNKKYEKIVINGRFLSQKLTGVQRYALEITKALDKLLSSGDCDIPKTWGGVQLYSRISHSTKY